MVVRLRFDVLDAPSNRALTCRIAPVAVRASITEALRKSCRGVPLHPDRNARRAEHGLVKAVPGHFELLAKARAMKRIVWCGCRLSLLLRAALRRRSGGAAAIGRVVCAASVHCGRPRGDHWGRRRRRRRVNRLARAKASSCAPTVAADTPNERRAAWRAATRLCARSSPSSIAASASAWSQSILQRQNKGEPGRIWRCIVLFCSGFGGIFHQGDLPT